MLFSARLRTVITLGAVLLLAVAAACEKGQGEPAAEKPVNAPAVVIESPVVTEKAPTDADAVDAAAGIESAAREFLAAEVGEGDFKIRSSEPVQWSDASLGCPEAGSAYAQVITPGHKLVFELGGSQYPVHTNADGSHLVLCNEEG